MTKKTESCVFYDTCHCDGMCRFYAPIDEDEAWVDAYIKQYYDDYRHEWEVYMAANRD